MKYYIIICLLFMAVFTSGALEAASPINDNKDAALTGIIPDFAVGLQQQLSQNKMLPGFKPAPYSSSTTDSSDISDYEWIAFVFAMIFVLPALTARAIAAQQQYAELGSSVSQSVVGSEVESWFLFGFSAGFSGTLYIILAALGALRPFVGLVGFAIFSSVYLANLIIAGALYTDSRFNWPRYNTYYNRATTYYLIGSAASLGTTLLGFFIYLGLYIRELSSGRKKRSSLINKNDNYIARVKFAPEILGLRVRFNPYLFTGQRAILTSQRGPYGN